MQEANILFRSAVVILLTVGVENAAATPLQSESDIPRLSGVHTNLGSSSLDMIMVPIIDVSTEGGLVGAKPILPSPYVGQEQLRSELTSGSRQVGVTPGLPGSLGSTPPNPSGKIFQEILSEANRSQQMPGFGAQSAASRRATSNTAPRERSEEFKDDQQMSLKDLIRLLINRPENLGFEMPVAMPAGVSRHAPPSDTLPQGASILNAILSVTIDKEIAQSIAGVLKPSVDPSGIVALNVFGLREIALLVSPSSNSVRLVDLESGRSMSFRYEDRSRDLSVQRGSNSDQPGGGKVQSRRENLLPIVIIAIRYWIQTYVLSEVTLISLLSLSILWVVWRFARSEPD